MLPVELGLGLVPQTMAAGQGVAMASLSRHPALNCCVWPKIKDVLAGVTNTAVATVGRTWRASEAVSPNREAVIVAVPGETPTTSPAALTVAMSGASLDQTIRDRSSMGQVAPAALSASGVTATLWRTKMEAETTDRSNDARLQDAMAVEASHAVVVASRNIKQLARRYDMDPSSTFRLPSCATVPGRREGPS
jgi:hypothetical protein